MALDELLDEHEQSERVRNWLRQNSLGLVGGLALGLALIGGGRWWMAQAHQKRVAEGEAYQAALDSIAAGDVDKAATQAAALKQGPYAALVAMDLAKAQLDAGKRDEAIATLRAVASDDPGIATGVRQRHARGEAQRPPGHGLLIRWRQGQRDPVHAGFLGAVFAARRFARPPAAGPAPPAPARAGGGNRAGPAPAPGAAPGA